MLADLFALSHKEQAQQAAFSNFLIKVVHIVVRLKTQLSVFNARKEFDDEKSSFFPRLSLTLSTRSFMKLDEKILDFFSFVNINSGRNSSEKKTLAKRVKFVLKFRR